LGAGLVPSRRGALVVVVGCGSGGAPVSTFSLPFVWTFAGRCPRLVRFGGGGVKGGGMLMGSRFGIGGMTMRGAL
jgi:hypothetical protein